MKKITLLVVALGLSLGFAYAQSLQRTTGTHVPVKIEQNSIRATPGAIDFEDIADFSLTFDPWMVNDVDGQPTYGINGVDFPNAYGEMAFICFNPSQTVPALEDPEWTPHGGEKYAASFAANPAPNDDWFMSSQITLPDDAASFNFWAKSVTDDYGLERFAVGVSTTGTEPGDFTIISEGDYVEAPLDWTEYTYDLADYLGQQVYVAIHCVSNDAFVFMLDDVVVTAGANVLFADDFESYSVGDYVAENSDVWTTWSNAPATAEDAVVSDDQGASPSQSMYVSGTNDMVLPLGNKVGGKYQINMKYWVPSSGDGGYYNIQHFEAPGTEWAYEVYFDNAGAGSLSAGMENAATFTFANDSWVVLENIIDLDKDSAWLFVDGVEIYNWRFSMQANDPNGTLQLGGVNIYAGAPNNGQGTYYVDDVEWIELVPPSTIPVVNVDNTPIVTEVITGATTTETLAIGNTGGGDLDFEMAAIYPAEMTKANGPKEDVVLNYDGESVSAIQLTNGGQWRAAAMFPFGMLTDYIHLDVEFIDVYLGSLPVAAKVQVYAMGSPNTPGPGELVYEQDFTPMEMWNHVILTTPVAVTGEDLWVGVWIDQPAAEQGSIGIDGGPANPNGDWMSTGPGWSHLSDSPDFDANWNIRAGLTGTAMPAWLSFDPAMGTVAAGGSEDVTLTIDAAGLAVAEYNAIARVMNNDLQNEVVDVPVNLQVIVGVNELGVTEAVAVYPNPAKDVINLQGTSTIKRVRLSNNLGQVVFQAEVNAENFRINSSNFENGLYILTMETENGVGTQKLIIE